MVWRHPRVEPLDGLLLKRLACFFLLDFLKFPQDVVIPSEVVRLIGIIPGVFCHVAAFLKPNPGVFNPVKQPMPRWPV